MESLPARVHARNRVLYDVTLSTAARVLYFILDDKANETGEVWWHWRKLAVLMGLSHAQFFEVVKELREASILLIRKDGRRCYYNIHSFRKTGMIGEVHSGKPEHSFRKTGMNPDISLVNQFYETVAPFKAEIPDLEPRCYRCRDTGREILGKRKICGCPAGREIAAA